MMTLRLRILDTDLEPPAYQHRDDAGLDLRARFAAALGPAGGRAVVPTGIAVELPRGHVGLICPRSGLALERGVTVLNAPGVIDVGYRGEIGVVLINLDPSRAAQIMRGDRIAQLVIAPVRTVTIEIVEQLGISERGDSGFGGSGP